MERSFKPMQFIISIVESGKGELLIEHYKAHRISQHIWISGRGTADSHTLDMMGFGTAERDVIISCGHQETVRQLMYHLKGEDRSKLNIQGIACSLNISGMSAIFTSFISRMEKDEAEREWVNHMEQKNSHSLILVSVNQGYTDAVMDTAKAAGAKGGTVIRARWSGADELQMRSGIILEEEKEVIAIVARNEDRNAIMEKIERVHCLRSAAQGIVISIPVDYTSRID